MNRGKHAVVVLTPPGLVSGAQRLSSLTDHSASQLQGSRYCPLQRRRVNQQEVWTISGRPRDHSESSTPAPMSRCIHEHEYSRQHTSQPCMILARSYSKWPVRGLACGLPGQ